MGIIFSTNEKIRNVIFSYCMFSLSVIWTTVKDTTLFTKIKSKFGFSFALLTSKQITPSELSGLTISNYNNNYYSGVNPQFSLTYTNPFPQKII